MLFAAVMFPAGSGQSAGISSLDVVFDVSPITSSNGSQPPEAVDDLAEEITDEIEDVDSDVPEVETETDDEDGANIVNGEFEGGSTETGTSFVREGTSGSRGGREPRERKP